MISFDAFPVAAGFGGLGLAAGKEPCSISGASAQLFGIISSCFGSGISRREVQVLSVWMTTFVWPFPQEILQTVQLIFSVPSFRSKTPHCRPQISSIRSPNSSPSECAAISGGFIGHHSIAGIGPGFVPENYNPYVVDTVLTVSSADAERAAREVLFYDGIPACSSAGATLCAATQLMGTGKCNRPLCIFAGRRTYE